MHNNTKELLSRLEEYRAYCKSPRFTELKLERWEIDNFECVLCARKAETIHHRRYPKILGTETINDVISLCNFCHKNFHKPLTIEECQKQLMEKSKSKNGTKCPVCGTKCVIYPRHLYFEMVKHFIKLSRLPTKDGWVQIGDNSLGLEEFRNYTRAEFQKLQYWGLIERSQPHDLRDGVWWRLTEKGKEFLSGSLKIPDIAYVLNGKVLCFSNEMVDILEAVGTAFNYNLLMSGKEITTPPPKKKKIRKKVTV